MTKKQKKNSISIKRYKNRRELNFGIFIFALVFIYLVVAVIMYTTSQHISSYEVREGSILRDTSYTGLVLRDETLLYAQSDGYINYFFGSQSKIRTGMKTYVISQEELEVPQIEDGMQGELSSEEQASIVLKIQNFNESFHTEKFSSVYSFKNEINTVLQDASNVSRMSQLETIVQQRGGNIPIFTSPRDGILSLSVDGKEGLTIENFTENDFDRSQYKSTIMEDNLAIKSGQPICKLIGSENWTVIIPLEEEMVEELQDKTAIRTRINKDSNTMWAEFSILSKENKFYGCLTFDNSMIRFLDYRYVTVELILEDQTGLKIPKSAVVEKEVYKIPQEFLVSNGSYAGRGVIIKDEDTSVVQNVDLYAIDEQGIAYISQKSLPSGTVIMKSESAESLVLDQTEPIQGVYNINKGYAVFYPITILCESDEYYIIQEGSSYGISNYDRIAQDGKTLKEDEVVFQ